MKRTGFSSKMGLWVNASLISLFILIFVSGCGGSADDDETRSGDTEKSEARKPAITIDPSPGGSGLSTALVVRTFDLPDGFFESDFARGGTARQILERDGGEFGEGMSASFNLSAGTLEVKATENDLWVIEAVVDYWRLIEEVENEARWQRIQKLEERLRDIVIPEVDFKDTPLEEALASIENAGDLANVPNAIGTLGVKIVLDPPRKWKEESGYGFDNPDETNHMPVSLKLSDVPLFEALRYTVSLAQRKYRIEETEIRVGYLDLFDELRFVRAYPAPPEVSRMIATQSEPAANPFGNSSNASQPFTPTLKSLLENAGITFSLDCDAIFDPRRGLIIMRNTRDQHELFAFWLQTQVVEYASDSWRLDIVSRFNQKVDVIALPNLSFETLPLYRVVDSIQLHSRIADREGPVWERGVPIWFNHIYDIHTPKEKPTDYIKYDTRITVDVSNLTIRKALHRIGQEIGADVTIEPEGIKLSPNQ